MRRPGAAEGAYLAVSTLALAAFVHLATVWLVPHFAERDAYSEVKRLMPLDQTLPLASSPDGKDPFPYLDPATPGALCRFDLARGPTRISLPLGRPGFLSLSLHADDGVAFFALTDRAASGGKLEVVLATAEQMKILAAHDDEDHPNPDLRILAPRNEGFAFARALAETPGLTAEAQSTAKGLLCRVEPLPG